MQVMDLGLVRFAEAFYYQDYFVDKILSGEFQEALLLLEHFQVYTIGRSGKMNNVLESTIETIKINRGGDITFHAPGQIVGYPLVNLATRRRDLLHYLRFLEEVLIQVAADFGVKAYRIDGQTGCWTLDGKLASIGVGARRWVTMHGFALNVSCDLTGFNKINPCGIVNCKMTSLEKITNKKISMDEVKKRTMVNFKRLLDQWLPVAEFH